MKNKRLNKTKILLLSLLFFSIEAYSAGNMYRNAVELQRTLIADGLFGGVESNNTQSIGLPESRVDVDIGYEYLDPNDDYGDWKSFNMSYYQKISDDISMLYQLAAFTREIEGDALLGSVGIYKGWNENMYTYTQITGGTHSEYLPKFRIDNDFNYKFGEEKNIVGLIGMTYINQFDNHEDFIISAGITYYQEDYNIGYRAFLNRSDPGKLYSTSHIVSLGVGHEKDQWVFVDVSYGNPSYLSTITDVDEEVNNDAFSFSVKYRKWLDKESGFYTQAGVFNLSEAYVKYEFRVGYFIELK